LGIPSRPSDVDREGDALVLRLQPMEELVYNFLGDYGWMAMIGLLLASGIGIPISEEVVNVPAGIFVGQGEMAAWSTFLAAYVGVLGGDYLWFSICRHFGKRLLHRKWFRRFIHPRRLLEAKHQFDRRGGGMLVIARFIPGTRSPALTMAALMHMSWRRFTVVEVICCAITTPIQVGAGVLIGRELAGSSLPKVIFFAFGVIAVIIASTAIFQWWLSNRRREKARAPRARVRWLRGKKSKLTTPPS
jgi:membrane protein DedA with SNARE-associated domain